MPPTAGKWTFQPNGENLEHTTSRYLLPDVSEWENAINLVFQAQDDSRENVAKNAFDGICNSIKILAKTNIISGRMSGNLGAEITICSDSLFSSVLRNKK